MNEKQELQKIVEFILGIYGRCDQHYAGTRSRRTQFRKCYQNKTIDATVRQRQAISFVILWEERHLSTLWRLGRKGVEEAEVGRGKEFWIVYDVLKEGRKYIWLRTPLTQVCWEPCLSLPFGTAYDDNHRNNAWLWFVNIAPWLSDPKGLVIFMIHGTG